MMKGSSKHTPKPLFLILVSKNLTNNDSVPTTTLFPAGRRNKKYNKQTNPYQK